MYPKDNDPIIVIRPDEIAKIVRTVNPDDIAEIVSIFNTKNSKFPKLLEIRNQPIRSKKEGCNVFCSGSGTGSIQSAAKYQGCIKMNKFFWEILKPFHQVEGDRLYGEKTWGWWLQNIGEYPKPIPYPVKKGSVIWRKFKNT